MEPVLAGRLRNRNNPSTYRAREKGDGFSLARGSAILYLNGIINPCRGLEEIP